MNNREKQLKVHGIQLLQALIDVNNAYVRFDVLSKENNVHKGTQEQLKKCLSELSQIRARFKKFWGEEGERVMQEQILSDEDTLQVQQINALVISMPKGIRNQIEQYAEGLAKVYVTNQ